MRTLCLILGVLLMVSSVQAGTLYLGRTPKSQPEMLIEAWGAIAAFANANIDDTDPALADVLNRRLMKRAVRARRFIMGIGIAASVTDAVAIAGVSDVSKGIVSADSGTSGNCAVFAQAVQQATATCTIAGDGIKMAQSGVVRQFMCKLRDGTALWGIEVCD